MNFIENASLKQHSSMRLGGNAQYLCTITSEEELLEALSFASDKKIPYRMIGSGSNIVWKDEGFDGLIIVNGIEKFELDTSGKVIIGSGVDWDSAVEKTVNAGFSGIEALSLIPGTTGATPVQNVGAYGVEIQDVFISLRAYDTNVHTFVTLHRDECEFGYRTSRFKTTDAGRFLITEITLQLHKTPPTPPFYESLQNYLDTQGVENYTPEIIRNAVIAVRQTKLPSPDEVANNGSFFANPIVSEEKFKQLELTYPDIKAWDFNGQKKIAAGWLVEKIGYKDVHDEKTGMATWKNQALVLVNEHAQHTADLLAFRDEIVSKVHENFGITLEQEPELL